MSGLRGLVLTNLFATPDQPVRATFNQQQFARLQGLHDLVIMVPMPQRRPGGRALTMWNTESGSQVVAFPVWHPAVIGRLLNARLLYRAARKVLLRYLPGLRPQFILGSFAYPDGV